MPRVDQPMSGNTGFWQPPAFAMHIIGRCRICAAVVVPDNGDLPIPLVGRSACSVSVAGVRWSVLFPLHLPANLPHRNAGIA